MDDTTPLPLPMRLEALLFYKGEPVEKTEAAHFLGVSQRELTETIGSLVVGLSGRGISLVDDGVRLELRTSHKAAPFIEGIQREELTKGIGKTGAETLAIVLYRGPISRADIDFIRGVNSSYTLRSLMMRGLVDRNVDERGKPVYVATTELLGYLGVSRASELPRYDSIQKEIASFFDLHQQSNTTNGTGT